MSINCVIKGTLITLEGEEKKIENLKVGEKLLSYSVEGLENTQDKTEIGKTKVMEFDGEFSYQLIKNIWKNSKGYYKINDKLSITGDHFVMCKSQDFGYYWIKVEDLKIDDSLFRFNNEFEIINDIKKIDEEGTVYNIQVNSIYSYFANGYLIHNGGTPCTSSYCGSYCGAQGF